MISRGGAAHDGVVHQQHVLAHEFKVDGVELLAHRLLAQILAGHDERAAYVAVFDESFAVWQPRCGGQLQRGGAAGVGDGDDHVNVMVGPLAEDFSASFRPCAFWPCKRKYRRFWSQGGQNRQTRKYRANKPGFSRTASNATCHFFDDMASPGKMSRTSLKPRTSNATLSDATI